MSTPIVNQPNTTLTARARPKILLIGDSLTQTSFEGWGSTLANVYQRRADIINRGCSGFNTSFYLPMMDNMEDIDDVCLVTIWFGANDASLQEHNPFHYVSIPDYSNNLKTIVETVNKKYKSPRIILITPPPVVHQQRFDFQKKRFGDKATGILERTLENAGLYANACRAVATELQLPCLNLYANMLANDHWENFFWDGLHFSKEGHDFVAQQLLGSIATNYPEITVTVDSFTNQFNNSGSICKGLPSWGPYHDQIDYKNIDKSFS